MSVSDSPRSYIRRDAEVVIHRPVTTRSHTESRRYSSRDTKSDPDSSWSHAPILSRVSLDSGFLPRVFISCSAYMRVTSVVRREPDRQCASGQCETEFSTVTLRDVKNSLSPKSQPRGVDALKCEIEAIDLLFYAGRDTR